MTGRRKGTLHLVVKLNDDGKLINVTKTKVDHMTIGRSTFSKRTFPLTLSYAVTAHKVQGCTIRGQCLLHVKHAFCPGMLYVMLSRVTTRENLFITRRLTTDDFQPVPEEFLV